MKVLLLGDSIRMFYQKEVTTQLGVGYKKEDRSSKVIKEFIRIAKNSIT
jgi:hypothetical protein